MGSRKRTLCEVLLRHSPLLSAIASAVAAVVSCTGFFHAREEARASRTEMAAQRAHAEAVFKASQAARLAFDRMTTRTSIQKTTDGWDIVWGPDGVASPQNADFGTICNFGPGVALNCSAEFIVMEINGERLTEHQVSSVKCSPMNILPNGAAHVYSLPNCVANDKAQAVRWAKGYVTFTFYTNAGKKETSSQKVEIRPDYEKGILLLIFEGPEFIDNGDWL
jgi:hypothetical protein